MKGKIIHMYYTNAAKIISNFRDAGIACEQAHGSYIAKNERYTMVFDVVGESEFCVGTVMTNAAYDKMHAAFHLDPFRRMSLACFALCHKWGWDLAETGGNTYVEKFQFVNTIHPFATKTNRIGFNTSKSAMYMVRQYVDELPDGECGISDAYYLLGLFSDIYVAAKEASKYPKETITIIPVLTNFAYEDDTQPFLGGGYYIE